MKPRFVVIYHPEARAFIKSLQQKVQEKIVYNITKSSYLVIATHGFIKKTQKTPQKKIARAEAIRQEYFNDRNK